MIGFISKVRIDLHFGNKVGAYLIEIQQPDKMQLHLFIATPCYGGVVTQGYMQSVCALMAAAPAAGLDLTLALLGQDALITRSRNTLVSHFMAHETATHILFVDADISFEPDHVFRLIQFRKPLVAGIYPLKAYDWIMVDRSRQDGSEPSDTAGLHYVGELLPETRIERDGDFATASFAGTGFMLIERAVIERLIAAYPETRYRSIHAHRIGEQASPDSFALFDCIIDPETSTYLSEDFTFCHRWARMGGQIWLDTAACLTHTGPSDFRGSPSFRYSGR